MEEGSKSETLRMFIEALASADEIDAANEAVNAFKENEADKAMSLVAIARAQGKRGDKAGARETLKRAMRAANNVHRIANVGNDNPEHRKRGVFREIAVAQAEAGAVKDALAIALANSEGEEKPRLVGEIATRQSWAGDFAGALETVATMHNEARMCDAYWQIAHDQSQAGRDRDALAWVAKLTTPEARSVAFLGIVKGQIDARKVKTAK